MLLHPAIQWPICTGFGASNGYGAKMSPRHHCVSLVEPQHHIIDPTNPRSALDDGVEDRLHIGGRAADNAEHLSSRCLMLQRLAQFCIALLQFLKQADVFDGDDRLIGKRFEQLNLPLGERTNLCTANIDRFDGNTFAKERGTQHGPITFSEGSAIGIIRDDFQKIMDMDSLTVDKYTTTYRVTVD